MSSTGRSVNKDPSLVSGNASLELKSHLIVLLTKFFNGGIGFADAVGERVAVTSVDIVEESKSNDSDSGENKKSGKTRKTATVICECVVQDGASRFRIVILFEEFGVK